MDDIVKFLLVAAVIVFSIIRQANKNKSETREKPQRMPIPDEIDDDAVPVPEAWGNPSLPWENSPQTPPPPPEPIHQTNTTQQSKPVQPSGISSKKKNYQPILSPVEEDSQPQPSADDTDFTIHSAEEARKAIVWSEILNRKY